jgi:hypothetical protein
MYSQHHEDDLIAAHFGNRVGCVLEIGAFGPRDMSNSRLLIERGWSAVLVDVAPGCVRSLLLEYGGNPRVSVIQAAVVPEGHSGALMPVQITDDAVSTTDAAHRAKWDGWGYYGALWTKPLLLGELMTHVQGFAAGLPLFASVDTEGTSIEIASHLILGWQPEVVCVEHDDRHGEFMETANDLGYRQLALNGVNLVIAR